MSEERVTPRQDRATEMRRHLLDIAAELFATHGFDNVTTNQIASRADVSVGSLYRYFADKAAMWTELTAIHVDGLDELFTRTVLNDPDLTLEDLLDQILDPIVDYWEQHPVVAHLMGRSPESLPGSARSSLFEPLVERVEVILDSWVPHLPLSERRTTALAMVAVTRALLFEVDDTDARQRQALRTELKYILRAYAIAKYPGPNDPVWTTGGNPPPARPARK